MKIGKIAYFLAGLAMMVVVGTGKVVAADSCKSLGGYCGFTDDICSKGVIPGDFEECSANISGSKVFFKCCVQYGVGETVWTPVKVKLEAAPIGKAFCDANDKPVEIPDSSNPRVYTALGCIPVKMSGFVTWLMPYLFGIAGGVSFLMMVMGFISIATSNGDPKAVAEASGKITSAITGLLVSIFAIFILRLIAVDILKIPGFN